MKRKIFLVVVFFSCMLCSMTRAQEIQTSKSFYDHLLNSNNLEDQEGKRKPAVLPYVDPSDILWAKTIWRELNLREKMNLPIYYPTIPTEGRMSLIDVLLNAIKNGKHAYEAGPTVTDEFATPIAYGTILSGLGGGVDTIYQEDGREPLFLEREYHSDEVKSLLVKELWFFNKKASRMEVRIIALCPVRIYKEADDPEEMEPRKRQLFWVDYNEYRDVLVAQKVLISDDIASSITYDDLFLKRRFNSRIIQESNVNGQKISAYTQGIDAILESERIKNEMFNKEQDLWEY